MKTIAKCACIPLVIFALGNCTYVEPTTVEPSTSTTTTTEHSIVPGGTVTSEETTTTYR
jgi:hypothetical protein